MKYTSILLIALFAFLTSCSTENEVLVEETLIDFSGTYEGKLNCTGELSDSDGEEVVIVISKDGILDSYFIDMGDESIFSALQVENVLTIGAQTINTELGFDMVSLEGEIRMTDDEMIFDFTHSVDDEGESTCSFPLVKR